MQTCDREKKQNNYSLSNKLDIFFVHFILFWIEKNWKKYWKKMIDLKSYPEVGNLHFLNLQNVKCHFNFFQLTINNWIFETRKIERIKFAIIVDESAFQTTPLLDRISVICIFTSGDHWWTWYSFSICQRYRQLFNRHNRCILLQLQTFLYHLIRT
jgi:hypothetical protein